MATLEQAISLAAKQHEGQVDKANAPYILHPLRVMLNVPTIEHKIVAVLHDILKIQKQRLKIYTNSVFKSISLTQSSRLLKNKEKLI